MGQRRLGLDRIQVAATLRRLREEAHVTRLQAADALACTLGKISNIETGVSGIKPAELEKLLDLYGTSAEERAALIETARASRSRRPRTPHGSLIPTRLRRMTDLEVQARAVMFYSPELIPGVLQTAGYARALLHGYNHRGDEEVERYLALRLQRRRILDPADGKLPLFQCVLSEAALRSNVGGPTVMHEQLMHLVRRAEASSNLAIQILPLGAGAHGLLGVTTTILKFDPPAPDVLHNDIPGRDPLSDKASEVAAAQGHFEQLQAQALGKNESLTHIMRVAAEYKELTGSA
ncbi:helix-turn-helix domain-containing protein [Longimycelium tulufanense]|nr:helix-turn-helix transcriptional regulator [Longimycelium tulufanense]